MLIHYNHLSDSLISYVTAKNICYELMQIQLIETLLHIIVETAFIIIYSLNQQYCLNFIYYNLRSMNDDSYEYIG